MINEFKIPDCCIECRYLTNTTDFEDSRLDELYCDLGVFLPTKKLSCKRWKEQQW